MRLGGNAIFNVEEYEREHGEIETVYVSCIVNRFTVPIIEEPMVVPEWKKPRYNWGAIAIFVIVALIIGLMML